jgi:hypothetical protein
VNVQVGVGLEIPLPAPPEPPPPYVPPPPPTMPVEERGFFDGDEVVIDLYLQDARSGDTLWSASARDWADPRDAAAVTRLLEQALAGHAWARRAARP